MPNSTKKNDQRTKKNKTSRSSGKGRKLSRNGDIHNDYDIYTSFMLLEKMQRYLEIIPPVDEEYKIPKYEYLSVVPKNIGKDWKLNWASNLLPYRAPHKASMLVTSFCKMLNTIQKKHKKHVKEIINTTQYLLAEFIFDLLEKEVNYERSKFETEEEFATYKSKIYEIGRKKMDLIHELFDKRLKRFILEGCSE